jgi:hypothetical protein
MRNSENFSVLYQFALMSLIDIDALIIFARAKNGKGGILIMTLQFGILSTSYDEIYLRVFFAQNYILY